ncbi:hypothetical protein [Thermoactinomyces mirandus]|uniref:Uncharacterized protein n=1 Tax=Thermoactinomyces mirandus TaxID=2756294 RepID=A0A7W1XPW6_9BACL|nr:hypothetical protein [Thermoactinomyces mirandus]MBA4601049.1 hypothetical protein [Thermoactinomyces mirandus]
MSEFQLVGLFLLVLGIIETSIFWIFRWKPKAFKEEDNIIVMFLNLILGLIAIDRFTLGLFFFMLGVILGTCLLIFG